MVFPPPWKLPDEGGVGLGNVGLLVDASSCLGHGVGVGHLPACGGNYGGMSTGGGMEMIEGLEIDDGSAACWAWWMSNDRHR